LKFMTFEQDTIINYLDKKMAEILKNSGDHTSFKTHPNEIIENFLYLGSQFCVREDILKKIDVEYILNLCATKMNEPFLENCKVLHLQMSDDGLDSLNQIFDKVLPFIEQAKANNKKILIHCRLGVNRSPTIVIAYLMKTRNCTLKEAFNVVKEKREVICPHFKYFRQLLTLEKLLFGKATTDITSLIEFNVHQGAVKMKKSGSGLISQWRSVYLVVDKKCAKLQLFHNESAFQVNSSPFHVVELNEATIKPFGPQDFHFEVVLDGLRKFRFQAHSIENKNEWISILEAQSSGNSVGPSPQYLKLEIPKKKKVEVKNVETQTQTPSNAIDVTTNNNIPNRELKNELVQ